MRGDAALPLELPTHWAPALPHVLAQGTRAWLRTGQVSLVGWTGLEPATFAMYSHRHSAQHETSTAAQNVTVFRRGGMDGDIWGTAVNDAKAKVLDRGCKRAPRRPRLEELDREGTWLTIDQRTTLFTIEWRRNRKAADLSISGSSTALCASGSLQPFGSPHGAT